MTTHTRRRVAPPFASQGYHGGMGTDLILIAIFIYSLVVIVSLVSEERDPSTTLAWILVLLLFPLGGIVLYLLFGRDQRRPGARNERRRQAAALVHGVLGPLRESHAPLEGALVCDPLHGGVSQAITRLCGTVPLPCHDLDVFTGGARKFERLIADIEAAREFVHLQYFIWESDELTGRVCDLLAEKVRSGVEVRVLYDWVGSAFYGKRQLKELVKAGAQVRPDRADWRTLNYRNHRKITVIDGRIAYTGGMNMGQEYADGGRRFDSWRDTHLRFRGPLSSDLHALFCARWYRVTGEDLFSERYFPVAEESGSEAPIWAQLAFSGPESEWQALRHIFHVALGRAAVRIRVQSPYFVPDQSIGDVLSVQAFAGVDVRLMMAGVHDKKLPWWAAFSYLDELVLAGGRALQYDAGFMHAKTLTVDGRLSAVGTTNFDIRSFALHDELQVFFYDEGVTRRLDQDFERDALASMEVTLGALEAIGTLARFRNAFARLFSRSM